MRKLVTLLAIVLLLAGCARQWEGDLKFKVTRIGTPSESTVGNPVPARVSLDLDQDEPNSVTALGKQHVADLDQFPSDVKVGDQVVCKVKQSDENGFDGGNVKVVIGPCKRA
jgi:co-chaperonin GroES (HSP10)